MAYTIRPAKEKLRIVFEGMKSENISALCQNGRQKRDSEKESLRDVRRVIVPVYARIGMEDCGLRASHIKPRPLGYVTPYDMLTGKAEEVIRQRKKQHSLAQKERKRINRQMVKSKISISKSTFFLTRSDTI